MPLDLLCPPSRTGLEEHFRLRITFPFPGSRGMNLLRGRRRAEEMECDALKEKR